MHIPGYKTQRLIGKGGMATVYLAIQESLERPVVLKVLDRVDAQNTEDMSERFMAEGRIIASLRHPNIITIYDIGISDNTLYISMEYVQGGDLKQRMELPISADEALSYLEKVASALAEAHKHGIVHRDVKPANILFRDEGTPLLTDFGIAKQVNTESDLTSTGIFLGSPNYVSPEQADGLKIDGRADIYSLGCIFYEMLTSNKPYISDSIIDIVIQHKQAPVPVLPEEHKELQPLLNGMMAKQREKRIPDAETLITEIRKIQAIRRRASQLTDPDSTTSMRRQDLRQRRAKQILGGLMLLGLIMFSSLKYVEIRIKDPGGARAEQISTQTVLDSETAAAATAAPAAAQPGAADPAPTESADAPPETPAPAPQDTAAQPATEEVMNALEWLARRSMDEYKLTYPPKDNAYYYYNRILELDPGNQDAVTGILTIADSYAVLAEQSLARNDIDKTAAYVDIGLRIDPRNQALLALRNLVENHDTSLLATVKSLFSDN